MLKNHASSILLNKMVRLVEEVEVINARIELPRCDKYNISLKAVRKHNKCPRHCFCDRTGQYCKDYKEA